MRKESGATLIELVVTLGIAAILTTQAVAGLSRLVRVNQLTTETNRMISALALARSEAIKRGVRVTVCGSTHGSACDVPGGYEQGWVVFEDRNNDARIGEDESIISFYNANKDDSLTIRGNRPVASYVSYVSSGVSRRITGGFQAGSITLCNEAAGRKIVIGATGRARAVETTCR
ncbi:MAG: GspH/FimT family pseudopilin [Gammaproteobacteria bacterium]|nr:GspH/FimT family pseudopilin [Gammaproteobacteria bacterium]